MLLPLSIHAQANAGNPLAATTTSLPAKVSVSKDVTVLPDVTYATYSGYRPLKLDLYSPSKPVAVRPAVVWIHGGGWAGGTPRMGVAVLGSSELVLSALAARGYVVAAISYRLSGEARFPAALHDAKAAVRWLRANATAYGIDPQRIAVWGESAGGHLASLLGTSCGVNELEGQGGNADQSSCVQAVVDFYGPSDFSAMDAQAGANVQLAGTQMKHGAANSPESSFLGCELAKCPAALIDAANPITYISDKTPPFLIMHGDADIAVPIQQSQMLYEALRARNVSARLEVIPGAGHVFMGATSQQSAQVIRAVMQFLDETLVLKTEGK